MWQWRLFCLIKHLWFSFNCVLIGRIRLLIINLIHNPRRSVFNLPFWCILSSTLILFDCDFIHCLLLMCSAAQGSWGINAFEDDPVTFGLWAHIHNRWVLIKFTHHTLVYPPSSFECDHRLMSQSEIGRRTSISRWAHSRHLTCNEGMMRRYCPVDVVDFHRIACYWVVSFLYQKWCDQNCFRLLNSKWP